MNDADNPLNESATHASPGTSPLTITYTGEAIIVDREQIAEEMCVPNLEYEDPHRADERPGEVAARLFEHAIRVEALVTPEGLRLECYSDDDADGSGLIFVAFPVGGGAGVTCGWRDVWSLARQPDDERKDNDPEVVAAALEFMVAELNTALGVPSERDK